MKPLIASLATLVLGLLLLGGINSSIDLPDATPAGNTVIADMSDPTLPPPPSPPDPPPPVCDYANLTV